MPLQRPLFFINSILLGVGLAMDAFTVSLANGLAEPDMTKKRSGLIAGIFGAFQTGMPLLGWVFVHSLASFFAAFQKFIPWISLALLLFIGIKMIVAGIREKNGAGEKPAASMGALLIQGVATSIDALSVGFTIADYSFLPALIEALLIGAVTFFLCFIALRFGRLFGARLAWRASVVGGIVLCAVGVEIFATGLF
ncbi:MAG: manganese efflux pump [Lachnospiraceae bacterium]|nr:manganese efflux pump [Lachnospiraceae bacterium]